MLSSVDMRMRPRTVSGLGGVAGHAMRVLAGPHGGYHNRWLVEPRGGSAMITQEQAREVMGATVYGPGEEKIGKVGGIFLDDQTGQPEWVTVNTGLFGANETFVPLAPATVTGDRVSVPYDKDTITNAPTVDPNGGHLSRQKEAELYRHYGRS
jgi:hypothetical protein